MVSIDKPKRIGFKERRAIIREERYQRELANIPDPWLSRKIAIGFVFLIYVYAYYVFVVRLCIQSMILSNRQGSRAQASELELFSLPIRRIWYSIR